MTDSGDRAEFSAFISLSSFRCLRFLVFDLSPPMQTDEIEIRKLVDDWLASTRAGDVDHVLSLMTDDVVFFSSGRPPMRKPEFAAASRSQPGQPKPKIDATSEIQEIVVSGDWAFLWTNLSVTVSLSDEKPSFTRAGQTLTVLKKDHGQWRIARDANLLAPVTQPSAG